MSSFPPAIVMDMAEGKSAPTPEHRNNGPQQRTPQNMPWTSRELGGKPVWDWLDLLIVPVVLGIFAGIITTIQIIYQSAAEDRRQQQIAAQTAKIQRVIEDSRAQESSLQNYLDLMTNLLMEHNLGDEKADNETTALARAQTLTTLRKMDQQGKRTIVLFLSDAGLIKSGEPVISLVDADLSDADLSNTDLSDADLRRTNLSNADLSGAVLNDANFFEANLSNAVLDNAEGLDLIQLAAATSLKGATMPDGQILRGDKNPNGPTFKDWFKDKLEDS